MPNSLDPDQGGWFVGPDLGPIAGPHRAVGNVSDNRCESDSRSRGREFNPGPVPYFCGD